MHEEHAAGRRKVVVVGGVIVAVVALLVLGNWIYWVADGRPGTPSEFRERVAATGLEVAWSNNGSRGGDGLVERACGPMTVSVVELDGQLTLLWEEQREALTVASAAAFQACAGQ